MCVTPGYMVLNSLEEWHKGSRFRITIEILLVFLCYAGVIYNI